MKKRILLIAFVITSGLAYSQQNISVGIHAGVISSGVRGDASSSLNELIDKTGGILKTSDRTGFFAGVSTNIPVGGGFSIEPGIYYSQKGYDLIGGYELKGMEFLGAKAKASLQNQYVDLPLMLKGNFGGFQIFAGPQLSYLLESNLKASAGLLGVNLLNQKIETINQFNRWDAAISGGVGYQFANGISIKAAYDHGLMKMDANESVHAYNRAVKVGLGLNF